MVCDTRSSRSASRLLMGYAGPSLAFGQGAFFLIGAAVCRRSSPSGSTRRQGGRAVGGNLAPRGGPRCARPSPPWSLPSSGSRCYASTAIASLSQRSRSPSWASASSPPGTASRAASTASRSRSRSSIFGQDLRGHLHAAVVWASVAVALLLRDEPHPHSRIGKAVQAISDRQTSAAALGMRLRATSWSGLVARRRSPALAAACSRSRS